MPPVDQFLSDVGAGALSTAVALPPGPPDTAGPAAQLYKRIDDEVTATNERTLALLKDNWDDFAGQLKQGDELIAKLDDEEKELAALELEVDGPDAFLPPLVVHLEEQQSLAASHLATTASVSLLTALVSFHTTTSALASATSSGALPSAIEALARVTSAVEDGADEWVEQTDAWKVLVRWASEEESRLEAALQGALEGCFDVVPAATAGATANLTLRERIAAAPGGPELPVRDLLQGLEDFAAITGRPNKTDAFLARLAKQVLRHFVAPFLEANGAVKIGGEERAVPSKPRLGFHMRDDDDMHVAELAPVEEQVDAIPALSDFLAFFTSHSSIFPVAGRKPSKHAATLAAHLTPSLQSYIISSHLSPSLPSTTPALPAYLALVDAASTFESTFLPSHGLFAFLPASLSSSREVEEQRVIRTWAARVPQHWARQVGDRALARVRTAVKAWDWGAGETVEVEVREEDEMLGLLLGLGLAEDGAPQAARTPQDLVLQTVPRGAQREMTMEEALAPKVPRAKTPPPPPPPAPAPAPVEPRPQTPPPPTQQGRGTLKRGKLGAARIAAPLPPRSPSPPPLFQGGDAPMAPAREPEPEPVPAPEPAESSPAPEPHALDRASVISPTLSPRGQHTTFELLEEPAVTLAGISTTADHAGEGEVGGAHSYAAEVKDEPRESPEEGVTGEGRVKVEEQNEHGEGVPQQVVDLFPPVQAPRHIKEESVEPEIPPTPSPAAVVHSSHSPSLGLTFDGPSPVQDEDVKPVEVKQESESAEAVRPAVDEAEPFAVEEHPFALGELARTPLEHTPSFDEPVDAAHEPYAPPPASAPHNPYAVAEEAGTGQAYPAHGALEDEEGVRDAYAPFDGEKQDPYAPVEGRHDPYAPVAGQHDPYAPVEAAREPLWISPGSQDPYAEVGDRDLPVEDSHAPAAAELDSFVPHDERDPLAAQVAAHDPYAAPSHEQPALAHATTPPVDPYHSLAAPADPYADEAEHDWYAQEEGDWYAQEERAYTPGEQVLDPYSSGAESHSHYAPREEAQETYAQQVPEPYAQSAPVSASSATGDQVAAEHHDAFAPVHDPYAPSASAHASYALNESLDEAHSPYGHESVQSEDPYAPHAATSGDARSQDPYAPHAATLGEEYAPMESTPAPPAAHAPPPPPAPAMPPPPPRSARTSQSESETPASAVPPPPRVGSAPAPPPRISGRAGAKRRQVYAPQYDQGASISAAPPAAAPPAPITTPFGQSAGVQPPRTVVSPPPVEQQQSAYAPMVPPIQPSAPAHNPYTSTLSSRASTNSLARSLPSRPTSAQRDDGPVLNHIQQRFASPPPRMSSPYVSLTVPPTAPQAVSGTYIPANDPLFADLFGSGASKSSRSPNFFTPDPPTRANSGSSQGVYGQPQREQAPSPAHSYGGPQQQQPAYGQQYSPYGYEQPAMRMRGGGGVAWDDEEDADEVRPVLRLRGGADLGDMEDDDGNRSADDWGFGDDAGGEEDAWGFDDDAAPPTPPSPMPASKAAPPAAAPSRKTVVPPISPPPVRPPPFADLPKSYTHAPSASVTSTSSSSCSLSRSRPPSYAFSPSLAPPPLPVANLAEAVEEPEAGDDAWGFGEEEDEAPSPAQPPSPPRSAAVDQAPRAPSPAPPSPPAALVALAPDNVVESHFDLAGDDEWGFGAEDGGVDQTDDLVESQVVAEEPSDLLEYEAAVQQADTVNRSPPPPAVADEVVDEERAVMSPVEPEPHAADDDDGWGIDAAVADEPVVETLPSVHVASSVNDASAGERERDAPLAPQPDSLDEPSAPEESTDVTDDVELAAFPLDSSSVVAHTVASLESHDEAPSGSAALDDVDVPALAAKQPDKGRRVSIEVDQAEPSALNLPPQDIEQPFPSSIAAAETPMPRLPEPLPHHDPNEPSTETPAEEADLIAIAAGPLDDAAQLFGGENPEDDWGLGGAVDEAAPVELASFDTFARDARDEDQQDAELPISTTLLDPQAANLDDDFVDFSAPVEAQEKPAPPQWEPLEDPGSQPITSPPLDAQKSSNVDDDDDVMSPIVHAVPLAEIEQLLGVKPRAREAEVDPSAVSDSTALETSAAHPPREGSMSSPEVIEHADAWELDGEQGGAEVLEDSPEGSEPHDGVHDSVVQHELERPAPHDESVVQHEAARPLVTEPVDGPFLLPAQDAHPQQRTFSPPPTALPGGDIAVDEEAWDWQDDAGAEALHDEHAAATAEGPVPVPGESAVQHESDRPVESSEHQNEPLLAETARPQERTVSISPSAVPHAEEVGWSFEQPADGAEIFQDEPSEDSGRGAAPFVEESAVQHITDRPVLSAIPADGELLPAELAQPEQHTFSPPPSALPSAELDGAGEPVDDTIDDPWDLEPLEPESPAPSSKALVESGRGADAVAARLPSAFATSSKPAVQHPEDRSVVDDASPASVAAQLQSEQPPLSAAVARIPVQGVVPIVSGEFSNHSRRLERAEALADPLDYEFDDASTQPPAAETLDAERTSFDDAKIAAPPAADDSSVQHEQDRPVVEHAADRIAASEAQPQEHTFSPAASSLPAEQSTAAAPVAPAARLDAVPSSPAEADTAWGWDGDASDPEPVSSPAAIAPVPTAVPPSSAATHAASKSLSPALEALAPSHTRAMSTDDWSWDAEDKDEARSAPPAAPSADPQAQAAPSEAPETPAPVRREKMMVSKQSREIVAIAEEVLLEAVKVASPSFEHPNFAPAAAPLLQTFISLLSLYRATAAVHNSRLLASVPAIGMQFANDAEWIGREVERIWRTATEDKELPVAQDQANEVQLAIESTRQLGRDTRQKQIAIQRAALMESLDEAGGFLRTSDDTRFQACERALQQVTHILQRLALVWKPVMTPTALYTTLGGLINEVLLRVLDEIEEQTDISEEESIRLNKLCKMLHELESLFDGSETSIGREVPTHYKFAFLSELLEASMADILFLFDHGHLVDFTPQELVRLVRALFADSPLRNRNIEKILRGHPTAPPEDEQEWGGAE